MPIKPWTMQPKKSLNVFGGLDELLNTRQARADEAAAKQQSIEDRVFGSIRQGQQDVRSQESHDKELQWLDERIRASKNPVVKPAAVPRERLVTVMQNGKRVLLPESKAAGMEAPGPERSDNDNVLVPVQKEDGTTVYMPRSQAAGARVPSPTNSGGATMQKAVAANETQLAVIDDAIRELEGHPSAVGLLRGLPMIGAKMDQRIDKGGVAARAQISNIGSLKIHDRSGAAVSVHEFPRLAPFVPSIDDTPETVRIKLGKLREAIETENGFLRGNGKPTTTAGRPAKPGVPTFEQWKAAKKGGTP